MPELPEVDAITGVLAKHSANRMVQNVTIVRQPKNNAYLPNFWDKGGVLAKFPIGMRIERVFRRGKHVMVDFGGAWYLDCHNAMTGYWDWEHEPWTFDYVEGARSPTVDDVRVRIDIEGGLTMRFHDLRFFGRIAVARSVPDVGPELMSTPHMMPGAPVVTLEAFAKSVLGDPRPVKDALMDQAVVSGIGNIYASEGCHLAGVDPHVRGTDLPPRQVPVLLEALRAVVAMRIPKIDYDSLFVYRQDRCGSCRGPVTRTEISKRATFVCRNCQGEPQCKAKRTST